MKHRDAVPTCLFMPPPGGPWRIRVEVADRFVPRLIGLLGRSDAPASDCGLLLIARSGVHTLGMRFVIDIAQLDRELRVLRVSSRVPPGRWITAPRGTRATLEMAADTLPPPLTGRRFYCNRDYP